MPPSVGASVDAAAAAAAGAVGAAGASGAGGATGAAGAAGASGAAAAGPAGVAATAGALGAVGGSVLASAAAGLDAGFPGVAPPVAFGAAGLAGKASRSLRSTGASIVEAADFTYSPFALSHVTASLLGIPNSLASVLTRTFDTSLLVLVRAPGVCQGMDRWLLVGALIAASSLSAHFRFAPQPLKCGHFVLARPRLDPRAHGRGVECSLDPEGPWQRSAPLRQIQAADGRMQVRTSTGLPEPGIREAQAVPGGDPKQVGLVGPCPAGDARSSRLAVLG